jgi:hypothetical protein
MHPHNHGFEDRKLIIEDLKLSMNKKYFDHIDESVPLHWLAKTVTQMIISKMYLVSDRVVTSDPSNECRWPIMLSKEKTVGSLCRKTFVTCYSHK